MKQDTLEGKAKTKKWGKTAVFFHLNSNFPNYGCRPIFVDWFEWLYAHKTSSKNA